MNQFRFNTGVSIADYPNNIKGGVDSGNGVIVIPFEADAPKGAQLAFLSDYDDLDKRDELIRCEVRNSALLSKYAYFHKPTTEV